MYHGDDFGEYVTNLNIIEKSEKDLVWQCLEMTVVEENQQIKILCWCVFSLHVFFYVRELALAKFALNSHNCRLLQHVHFPLWFFYHPVQWVVCSYKLHRRGTHHTLITLVSVPQQNTESCLFSIRATTTTRRSPDPWEFTNLQ